MLGRTMGSGNRAELSSASPDKLLCGRLRAWYESPLGQSLAVEELGAVRDAIANLFGYHVLLIEPPWAADPLDSCRIPHKIQLDDAREGGAAPSLAGLSTALPIATDSLDVIVLPHVLERSSDPHQVLREVDRCLIPEGHVIILGFNPFSLWGLWRVVTGWRGQIPWCMPFLGLTRIRDWLALLGFDVLEVRNLYYRPPVQNAAALDRLVVIERLGQRGWPLPAAGYQLLARKRVFTLTPIRPRWRPRRGVLGAGVVEPTPRSS
jgi:SAM-dependent methyltransferase